VVEAKQLYRSRDRALHWWGDWLGHWWGGSHRKNKDGVPFPDLSGEMAYFGDSGRDSSRDSGRADFCHPAKLSGQCRYLSDNFPGARGG